MLKKLKKILNSWVFFIGLLVFLYFSGLHTQIMGTLQGLFLKTSFITTGMLKPADREAASYALSLRSTEGKTTTLAALKGKTIFLNFWATWCPPCIAEMPEIHELYQSTDTSQVAFVMVSVDKDAEKLEKFLKKHRYTFPVYQLNGSLPGVYQSSGIPLTFLISPSGKIVLKKKGMASYNNDSFKAILQKTSEL